MGRVKPLVHGLGSQSVGKSLQEPTSLHLKDLSSIFGLKYTGRKMGGKFTLLASNKLENMMGVWSSAFLGWSLLPLLGSPKSSIQHFSFPTAIVLKEGIF